MIMSALKSNNTLQAVFLAIVYTIIIGIGMYILKHVDGVTYGDPRMVETLWWVEIILTLLAVGFVVKYSNWSSVGFGKLRARALIWLLIPLLIIVHDWWQFSTVATADVPWGLFFLLGFTLLLVGVSEELVYRGFILRKLLQTRPLWQAMLFSAALFSLLHSVNIFAGLSGEAMLLQLAFTFVFGLFTVPLALRLNSLYPLIILHWQHDFVVLSQGLVPNMPPVFSDWALVYNVIAALILWLVVLRCHKKSG